MRKILFITGTRADYGKLKPLMKAVERADGLEAHIYVSGMHLLKMFGNTYQEVLKDGYEHTYLPFGLHDSSDMSYDLGNMICVLTGYISHIQPDMIVVHGDRIDALAGAIVGALHNICVGHIEGGEISGTIDESIRHAISKFAHIHFVCNEEAKQRLVQLGEIDESIHVIGSPDIDIMMSKRLPTFDIAIDRYNIPFKQYAILMYHPVTTDYINTGKNVRELVDAVIDSGDNYIVVYPNNDYGSEIILNEYKRFEESPRFQIFPSIRFEYFLTLLKNSKYMLGNSSAGIRETGIYGVPSIDIGSRQAGRYTCQKAPNIQHVNEVADEISSAIKNVDKFKTTVALFGDGKSAERFIKVISSNDIWSKNLQKRFVDLEKGL